MRKLAGIFLCVLAVLNGCATAPRRAARSENRPPDWDHGVPATKQPESAPLPAVASALPAPSAPISAAPELTWIALNRWLEEHGLGPLRRVAAGPVESYALVSPRGVMRFNMGSLVARWEELEVRLGFAPQLANDTVLFHALDVAKNIEPLLRGYVPVAKLDRLVVIDPGHGGSNLGTSSVADARAEKHFTLDWAVRLAPLLEANGWRVLLTRTNDVDVALADRVAFAEEHRADLFISLHFNSAGNGNREATGLETFCLTPTGMASSLTRGEADDPAQIFPNNAFDGQNLMYAARLHAAVLRAGGQADRGVRRARFLTVLRGQNRPAVLIEGGFLSNAAEARRVTDPAFRQRLAEGVAEALR